MTSQNTPAQVAEAQGRISRLEDRRAALLSELLEVRVRRALHSRDHLLNGAAHHKAWASAVADETQIIALIADADALLPTLNKELSRAEAEAQAANNRANTSAFAARLAVVLRERGIVVPSGEEAKFEANAESAYRWLATMCRTVDVDRTRYFTFWQDAMIAARYGVASRAELLAAAWAHGDIIIENHGDAWNTFLSVNQYIGRPAQSLPLNGDPTPVRAEQKAADERVQKAARAAADSAETSLVSYNGAPARPVQHGW